ncbi:MAG: molecular chaperone [Rhodothermales bacterium]
MESQREVGRANLFHLLAKAFSSPLEMEEKYPDQLRQVALDLPVALQEAALALVRKWEEAFADREALSLAYARLFLGPFEIKSMPYASHYLEPDQRLMGEVSQYVARAYVQAGLGPGSGPHEAPDHVALEWEFMYYLTYQYVTTGEDSWIEQRDVFRVNHMNRWMPKLVEAMRSAHEHAFYEALAELTARVLDDLSL